MSVKIPRTSMESRFHSQPIVSNPSYRSIHAFQAETPQDLGLLAYLGEQIVKHLILLSAAAILRSTVG